jgi:aryl-alcohol dehydrogenase-like predicted oxidoreductase
MGALKATLAAGAPPAAAAAAAGAPAPSPAAAQCFTKWCPQPKAYTAAEVAAALDRSTTRMQAPTLDLLQLHWWDYALRAELQGVLAALRAAQLAGRIRELGLTNFDSAHVIWMVDELKLPIASNQVQFSLVDARPLARMAPACAARGVKLLTYGTLLGGLLTDAWLARPAPTKAQLSTPSLGKYFRMVEAWGGWVLFQGLLRACRAVADRHSGASVATVAIAWVLRQPAVGGVIVGLRAGLSEHSAENGRALALAAALSEADLAELGAASRAGRDLLAQIGDCGDEYR